MAHYQPNQPYEAVNLIQYRPHNYITSSVEYVKDENRKPVMVFAGTTYNLSTDKYGDIAFLEEISKCQPLMIDPGIVEWQYDYKTTAQHILPFLMLGPLAVARDPQFVQHNNITMIISVRDGRSAVINPKVMDPARFASAHGIETLTFDMFDEQDLIRRCPDLIKKMNQHLATRTTVRPVTQLEDVGGKILVFCEAGDRRSAAVVTLFLMVVFDLESKSAVQAVQARRYGININGALYQMVKNYGEVLLAERQVAESFVTSVTTIKAPKALSNKRTLDQAEAEDAEMEGSQEYHNPRRTGYAPFKDIED